MLNYLFIVPNAVFKLLFGKLIRDNMRAKKMYLSMAKFLAEKGFDPPLAVCSWAQERGWANIEIGGSKLDLKEYTVCDDSTEKIFEDVLPLIGKDANILEIGCSVGRNLNYLYTKGYKNLTGIDISPKAIELMPAYFPEMSSVAKRIAGNAPKVIRDFESKSFDLVFCHSVLVNIGAEHNYIFKEMARICRAYIVTFENEGTITAYPRNFQRMFERHGFGMVLSKIFVKDARDGLFHYKENITDGDIFKHLMLRVFSAGMTQEER